MNHALIIAVERYNKHSGDIIYLLFASRVNLKKFFDNRQLIMRGLYSRLINYSAIYAHARPRAHMMQPFAANRIRARFNSVRDAKNAIANTTIIETPTSSPLKRT